MSEVESSAESKKQRAKVREQRAASREQSESRNLRERAKSANYPCTQPQSLYHDTPDGMSRAKHCWDRRIVGLRRAEQRTES
jgi:hypothetical protein